LAAGALVIVCLLWGYNWVIMKIGLRYAGPFDYLAIRVGGGAICLFLLLLVTRRPLKPEALGYSTALGFLQVTGNLGLITWALAHGAVGRTSVLGYTMPFWVLILAWPILGERIRGAEWVAIVLAFAGLVFIFNPSGAHGTMAATVMATGGGVFWAGATVVTRILHRRRKVDLLSLAAWQMLLGAIPLIVVALLVPSRPMEWNLALVGTLAFSIVFATVVAWFLWLFVLRYLPAGLASV
ncbi:MAG: EamA family transporter, partial [Thermoleophilia bacterium]|nr:EamA family transporter [Thermoleophilia bacterium]